MCKNSEIKLKRYLENIGEKYESITNRRSFKYYLERRKGYLKDYLSNNLKNDSLVLDLGAGICGYSDIFKNHEHILNIDLSFNALKCSKDINNKISKINADALNIPLKSCTVDIIFLMGILHHVPYTLEKIFAEILRVLKKGGVIFIDEPNGYNILWFIFMKLNEIDRVMAKPIFPFALRRTAQKYFKFEKEWFWGFMPPWVEVSWLYKLFLKIEKIMENSFLSFLCTRYMVLLKK